MHSTYATLSQALRSALLAGGVAFVIVAAIDWAVRTRRINPFNGVSRFMRNRVEPRFAGIERLVVRAGGHPAATPMWVVVAYMLVALLVLAMADFVADSIGEIAVAVAAGPVGLVVLAVQWSFGFLILALIVRVVASWVPRLATSGWARWSHGATEWMLRPLRRVLPSFGPIDITPLVAYFALQAARFLVLSMLRHAIQ